MSDELNMPIEEQVAYTDDNIRHLSDMEHVRLRPGMYIGKLGDGTQNDDGIYVLLKEIIDNRIYQNYMLHETNYIAHDILHRSKEYSSYYTTAAVKKFKERMAYAEGRFMEYGINLKAARKVYLGIYAGAVDTKK